ncbi:MAG: amidohydrolase family protein [Gemmatimonadaceae bacterium]|nr:amidohydrolase family protein [Gemmatimonadaceae bacterium]
MRPLRPARKAVATVNRPAALSIALMLSFATACSPAKNEPGTPGNGGGGAADAYDVVIVGGRVVDGTGNAWRYADVGIRGDRIARITPPGRLGKAGGKQRLDAAGRWMTFGTDADGWDPDAVKGVLHPRTYGTFPRILGYYVRERKLLSLEEAVRKMTSATANRLSIRDRGQLREGFFADVVIFDPTTIIDRATFAQSNQLSLGVEQVLVNGVLVLHNCKHTGAKPGRVVRGPGWSGWEETR